MITIPSAMMRPAEKRRDELEEENARLRQMQLMTVEQKCAKYHVQDCANCNNTACGDNMNPVVKQVAELKAAIADHEQLAHGLRGVIDEIQREKWQVEEDLARLLDSYRWISVKEQEPPSDEPIVYARPDLRRGPGRWHVGIAYWTVSARWNPECQSTFSPQGFTHWMPLPKPPEA